MLSFFAGFGVGLLVTSTAAVMLHLECRRLRDELRDCEERYAAERQAASNPVRKRPRTMWTRPEGDA